MPSVEQNIGDIAKAVANEKDEAAQIRAMAALVDLASGLFTNIERIANALERIGDKI